HEECCAVARRRNGDRTTEGLQRAFVPTTISGPVRAVVRTNWTNSLLVTSRTTSHAYRGLFRDQQHIGMFPVTFPSRGNHTARFHEQHRAKPCGKRAKPGDYARAADRGVS